MPRLASASNQGGTNDRYPSSRINALAESHPARPQAGGQVTRDTYDPANPAHEATTRVLAVKCPKCAAAPGAWCEYATYHPGRYQYLHVARIRAAA